MRRNFNLPEQDVEFLELSGYQWEAIQEGNRKWLIIYNFPVPEGYHINSVNIGLDITPGYPVAQIDMVYFDQPVQLKNNRQIRATAYQPILGKNWVRWSRHRTGENPWRPGLDDVCTHLQLVTYWMERELTM